MSAPAFLAHHAVGSFVGFRPAAGVVLDEAFAEYDGAWTECAFAVEDTGETVLLLAQTAHAADLNTPGERGLCRVRFVPIADGHVGLVLSVAPVLEPSLASS